MTTRSGTHFHLDQAQSSAQMESRLEEILKGLSEQMAQTQVTLTQT